MRENVDFVIRPVRPEEYASLGELIVDAYRHLEARRNDAEDEYENLIRNVAHRAAVSCVLVAVGLDGELLGGVTYVSGPDDPYSEDLGPNDAGMRMLAVDPGVQGRGIGRALVEACIDRARDGGRTRLVLHTTAWMSAAQRLYSSLGFRREPAHDWQPVPSVSLLCFVLEPLPRGV